MTKENNIVSVSFSGLLALLFIGLKLGRVIDWSWLWVLSPLWIQFGVILLILLVSVIMMGVLFIIYLLGGKR